MTPAYQLQQLDVAMATGRDTADPLRRFPLTFYRDRGTAMGEQKRAPMATDYS